MLNRMRNLIRSLLGNEVYSEAEEENLKSLMEVLHYQFSTIGLLKSAITHTSLDQRGGRSSQFERMEFLGDSILGLVIAELLFEKFPEFTEGELSKLKAKVVSRKFLAAVAREINLGNYLFMSREADRIGGRNNSSILADSMEAVICAIYLDGGIEKAHQYISRLIFNNYERILGKRDLINYKSKLQEYTQNKNQSVPVYGLVKESGPDHDKTFVVEVIIENEVRGKGVGHTKKEAQQHAAKAACLEMGL